MWSRFCLRSTTPKTSVLLALLLGVVFFADPPVSMDQMLDRAKAQSQAEAATNRVAAAETREQTPPAPEAQPARSAADSAAKATSAAPILPLPVQAPVAAADMKATAPSASTRVPTTPAQLPATTGSAPVSVPAEPAAPTTAAPQNGAAQADVAKKSVTRVAKTARRASKGRRYARRRGALGLLLADEL
jgi:cytoskeletal protein RodZ